MSSGKFCLGLNVLDVRSRPYKVQQPMWVCLSNRQSGDQPQHINFKHTAEEIAAQNQ